MMVRKLCSSDDVTFWNNNAPAESMGGGLNMAVGTSREERSDVAAVTAWNAMQEKLGGPPTLAFIYCNSSADFKRIAEALRTPAGAAFVVGGSSCGGVLTNQ